MNKVGHPAIKECRLHLQPEKIRIVRKQRGVEVGLHRGQIDAVVFKAGVVPHHQKTKRRKQQNGQKFQEFAPYPETNPLRFPFRQRFHFELQGRWHVSGRAPQSNCGTINLDGIQDTGQYAGETIILHQTLRLHLDYVE